MCNFICSIFFGNFLVVKDAIFDPFRVSSMFCFTLNMFCSISNSFNLVPFEAVFVPFETCHRNSLI